MLGAALDIFRLRQVFDVLTRTREFAGDLVGDLGFLDAARRALLPIPLIDGPRPDYRSPFTTALEGRPPPGLRRRRVAVVATGGSGALAALVGVGRALEEAGVTPAVISVCSGSALFGFPLAAGIPAEKVARFTLGLSPADYIDPNWRGLLRLAPTLARGFAGITHGDRVEEAYARLLGDMRLGDLAVPCYAPIWNVEANRLECLGPATYPDVTVAHAIRMAVSLPLFIEPVWFDGGWWTDGGIVDIFPVAPVLDIEAAAGVDLVMAVNCFYPSEFAGEDQAGWRDRPGSILYEASQVRTCQQAGPARANLARLREAAEVLMIEPVPYQKVRGLGFYRQFIDNREWGAFMAAGREHAWRALVALSTASSRRLRLSA